MLFRHGLEAVDISEDAVSWIFGPEDPHHLPIELPLGEVDLDKGPQATPQEEEITELDLPVDPIRPHGEGIVQYLRPGRSTG